MAYVENNDFKTPSDETTIWHFMNFPEFCSILVHGQLFFTRADCFDDPWEGAWPKYYHDPEFWRSEKGMDDGQIKKRIEFFEQSLEKRKTFGVSCWHINAKESEPFWKLYSNQAFGIAIKSTIGSLKRAMANSGWPVSIGAINYIDFETPKEHKFVDALGLDIPILYKREAFKHEHELRAFIRERKHPDLPFGGDRGAPITIAPEILLEEVVVSPMATDWFVRVVEGMLKKFNYENIKCYRSTLYDRPSDCACNKN